MDKKPWPLKIWTPGVVGRHLKRVSVLSALLFSFCTGFSQTPRTLLWQVTGKNLSKPSYLFGTMHILCAEDARISDSLQAVIASCDKVYFEINLSDMAGMMFSALKYMKMTGNTKLSDLLDTASYRKVKNYFNQHTSTLPFGMLERFKPMVVSSLIEEQDLPCKTADGMELMIMQALRPYNKPIDGLETLEFQAALFDSIPYSDQARDLVGYIDSVNDYQEMSREITVAYRQQDLDKIDALSVKGDPGTSKYMDLLLYDRNRKWAKMLDTLFSDKSLLVAVGAAHLPGDNGLINLLRREGYTVLPVKN